MDVSYPAEPSQIAPIRRAVVDAAKGFGAGEGTLANIGLAVSEAVTNAVLHAYRDRVLAAGDDVRVVVRAADDRALDVRVRDRGVGPSPRGDSPGLGLGLGLMAREARCFEIRELPEGGTEVVLRFDL